MMAVETWAIRPLRIFDETCLIGLHKGGYQVYAGTGALRLTIQNSAV
jgi:hypothetical protein